MAQHDRGQVPVVNADASATHRWVDGKWRRCDALQVCVWAFCLALEGQGRPLRFSDGSWNYRAIVPLAFMAIPFTPFCDDRSSWGDFMSDRADRLGVSKEFSPR